MFVHASSLGQDFISYSDYFENVADSSNDCKKVLGISVREKA